MSLFSLNRPFEVTKAFDGPAESWSVTSTPSPVDSSRLPRLLPLITKRIRMQGFIVSDHAPRWLTAIDELSHHVAAGRIRYRETIADGLAAAPEALIRLLQGGSLGKQSVRLG